MGRMVSAGLLVALLAACDRDPSAAPEARPVLVVHPEGGSAAALTAYAGEIRAREESALSFRVGGNLVRRAVAVGDRVRRGQLLAELDPGDQRLQEQAARAQAMAAETERVRAGADRARYAKLAQQQLLSRSAMDAQNAAYAAAAGQANVARAQFEVARNQAAYTRLRAPRDGVIATRMAEAGQVVAAGQTVFTLAGDGGREVAIAVPESRIRDIHPGQSVVVQLWSMPAGNRPGSHLSGTIREIAPVADPQARTYAARIALDPAAAQSVELGQSARVYIADDGNASSLRVPLAAVQRDGNGATALWVVDPATRKLHLAPVQLGAYGEDRVPVLRGVSIDTWIVAAGGHLLREGQPVTPVDRDNRPIHPAQPK